MSWAGQHELAKAIDPRAQNAARRAAIVSAVERLFPSVRRDGQS
ncbi:hypothetical protein [Nocardia pseudovaccinii]|nr:hypothetical protein [Nocardia pseudovaccinii]